jgi:peptide-methionine (S)-S-oxide reductase
MPPHYLYGKINNLYSFSVINSKYRTMKPLFSILLVGLAFLGLSSCSAIQGDKAGGKTNVASLKPADLEGLEKAYFASGCFWCVEAIYESVKGVPEVISGYSGGKEANATYPKVSSGATRHAEAVEVYYDPAVVDYVTLLKVFFGSHDPTTLNQQGPDRGPQYRSAIFYRNETEKEAALSYIEELTEAGTFAKPIVTEVVPFEAFYPAEDYHQNYERNNPFQPYVMQVSVPRLKKFQRAFPELLKEEGH